MFNMSYGLRSAKENLESQIVFTETNLRYLLGANPRDERHIKWTQDKIKELKENLKTNPSAPQTPNVYYHEWELKKMQNNS
jgi:hypothetical protein